MSTPYYSIAIANYFIGKSFSTGVPMVPLKLVKMVYLAHGWHLAIKEKPLIGEAIQAWKYGPSIPSVYQEFSKYGTDQITQLGSIKLGVLPIIAQDDGETLKLLERIWEVYSNFTPLELSTITHQKDTPWEKIKNGENWNEQKIIPNNLIQQYFKDKLVYENEKSSTDERSI